MLTFAEWLVFALTGEILIYVWFQFPLPLPKNKNTYIYKFFEKLHSCDLCAGTWIYSFLALATQADMSGSGTLVTQIATGIVTSFIVHVFVVGLKEKFLPPTII